MSVMAIDVGQSDALSAEADEFFVHCARLNDAWIESEEHHPALDGRVVVERCEEMPRVSVDEVVARRNETEIERHRYDRRSVYFIGIYEHHPIPGIVLHV